MASLPIVGTPSIPENATPEHAVSATLPVAPTTVYQEVAQQSTRRAKEGPSGVETLHVAHDLAYTWDYATQRTDLRVLYEKSKDLMWNARTYLPWDTEVDPERENVPDHMNPLFGTRLWPMLDPKRDLPKLRRHQAAYSFSNFLHGEQGALMATSQIVAMAPTAEAKFYAAAQVFDEARHVEAYDRYLREKIELVYPISPHLRQLLDMIMTDTRWDFKFLGMQIMVEGIALGAFGLIEKMSYEPLIKSITQMIMQDESRHVAFGVLALKDTYVGMTGSELRDREDFIIQSAQLMHDRFLQQEVWERMNLPQKECEEYARNSESMRMFRKLVFCKIVPNVKRLGLLTPYVRKAFEELGIIEYETWEASA